MHRSVEHRNDRNIFYRILTSRSFLITLALAAGLSPVYLFPDYFFPLQDVTTQLYPFLLETKRMLSSGAPWWTWTSFLGDNFIGSYAYYTFTRPLMLAVCLLPYKYIGAGLAASVYINFLILGWLSSCYFRIMGFDRRLRLIGSLLFTLSTYMICQLIYCMFFEPVQAFVILLICIERFLGGRRYSGTTLALASFAVAFVNYYFMPASLISGAVYFVCRAYFCHRARWISLTVRAAGCVCLGVLMASVSLMPVMIYISESARTGTSAAETAIHYGNNWALRALSLVAPTPCDGKLYLSDIDSAYYMNMAYVGIFGILPYLLYAAHHRHSWLTVVCAIFIVCLLTPLNGVFSLFTHPYYTRWAYALILMLLTATLRYLDGRRGMTIPRRATLIYIAMAFYFLAAVYCYSVFLKIYNHETRFENGWDIVTAAVVLLALNAVALLLLTRRPVLSRQWTRTCVACVCVIAVAHLLFISYSYAPRPFGKNSVAEDTEAQIVSRSHCSSFTARTYFEQADCIVRDAVNRHANLHLFSNRQSLTSYVSTLCPGSTPLAFLIQHNDTWTVVIDRYHESAVTLLSVKDFSKYGDYPFTNVSQAALDGDRYIPMGMAYDRYSLKTDSIADVERAKTHDIFRGMLASLVIDKADEPELSRYMAPVEFRDSLPFDSLVAARRAHTCDSFKGDTRGFTATISLPDTMPVMFSVAADPGFTATIDGKPARIYNVNLGMSASVVPAGRHTIRYEYFPPGLKAGALLSLAAFLAFGVLAACESRRRNF